MIVLTYSPLLTLLHSFRHEDILVFGTLCLGQEWPNYSLRAASNPPASLILPAKYLAHFYQAPRFQLWTAVQQHWLLLVT